MCIRLGEYGYFMQTTELNKIPQEQLNAVVDEIEKKTRKMLVKKESITEYIPFFFDDDAIFNVLNTTIDAIFHIAGERILAFAPSLKSRMSFYTSYSAISSVGLGPNDLTTEFNEVLKEKRIEIKRVCYPKYTFCMKNQEVAKAFFQATHSHLAYSNGIAKVRDSYGIGKEKVSEEEKLPIIQDIVQQILGAIKKGERSYTFKFLSVIFGDVHYAACGRELVQRAIDTVTQDVYSKVGLGQKIVATFNDRKIFTLQEEEQKGALRNAAQEGFCCENEPIIQKRYIVDITYTTRLNRCLYLLQYRSPQPDPGVHAARLYELYKLANQNMGSGADLSVIAADGQKLFCHQLILRARAPTLESPSCRAQEPGGYGIAMSELSIPCSRAGILSLLEFIYTDNIRENPLQNIEDAIVLRTIGQEHGLAKLCQFASCFLASQISAKTFLQIEAAAQKGQDLELSIICKLRVNVDPSLKEAVDLELTQKLADLSIDSRRVAQVYSLETTTRILNKRS